MSDATSQEERIAHLVRSVEDLSDVVAEQGKLVDRLSRQVALLMLREAERDADGGTVTLGDVRPPHY
jgi:SlyX protein